MPNTLSFTFDNPSFTLEKNEAGRSYAMRFTQGDTDITIQVPPSIFDALVNQGQALLPLHEKMLPDIEAENVWRETGWILKQLDDRSLQLVMRELQHVKLITVLWYLKDRDFAKTVMRNMNKAVAEKLTDDLITAFEGQNPDNASADRREEGRLMLNEMLSILYRLADEGQIDMEIPR